MDKNTKMHLSLRLGLDDASNNTLVMESRFAIEELASICRKDWKKGGGCPVGNALDCPFLYEPYVKRHAGERPIGCGDVTVDDWIELYEIVAEEDRKGS